MIPCLDSRVKFHCCVALIRLPRKHGSENSFALRCLGVNVSFVRFHGNLSLLHCYGDVSMGKLQSPVSLVTFHCRVATVMFHTSVSMVTLLMSLWWHFIDLHCLVATVMFQCCHYSSFFFFYCYWLFTILTFHVGQKKRLFQMYSDKWKIHEKVWLYIIGFYCSKMQNERWNIWKKQTNRIVNKSRRSTSYVLHVAAFGARRRRKKRFESLSERLRVWARDVKKSPEKSQCFVVAAG